MTEAELLEETVVELSTMVSQADSFIAALAMIRKAAVEKGFTESMADQIVLAYVRRTLA